jgi:predicted amidohydrolase
VKVAIAQKSPAFMNRDASVARACAAMEEARRNGAQLAAFPSAFEMHTGPPLEEPEQADGFWGHFEVRRPAG